MPKIVPRTLKDLKLLVRESIEENASLEFKSAIAAIRQQ